MDREAASNRSLWDVTQLAGTAYETVGDNARGRGVRVPFKDSVQGYQLVGNQLRAMDLSAPENHDFMGVCDELGATIQRPDPQAERSLDAGSCRQQPIVLFR